MQLRHEITDEQRYLITGVIRTIANSKEMLKEMMEEKNIKRGQNYKTHPYMWVILDRLQAESEAIEAGLEARSKELEQEIEKKKKELSYLSGRMQKGVLADLG